MVVYSLPKASTKNEPTGCSFFQKESSRTQPNIVNARYPSTWTKDRREICCTLSKNESKLMM